MTIANGSQDTDINSIGKIGNMAWVEKYRPSSFDEFISHKDIVSTLSKLIAENRLPHLLFYGPPGTGKTSAILAASKMMFNPKQISSMILELNASDDRGINIVREQIMNFAQTRTLALGSRSGICEAKLIILDEADAMTKDAQNALRRIIEKFTGNVRFCIICNYISKIIPAVQSRCTRFRFAPLIEDQISPRLHAIVKSENVIMTDDGEKALLKLADGDMRRVINILQSTTMAFPIVNEANVYKCVGHPIPSEVDSFVKTLLNGTFLEAFRNIQEACRSRAYALSDILRAMHESVYQLEMPPHIMSELISRMADIEYRLDKGCSDRIQLAALVAAFIEARDMITSLAE